MCGIAGYIGPLEIPQDRVEECLRRMKHRGPDHAAFRQWVSPAGHHVCLLHTRLSILDLDSRANQPYQENERALVFNGEIYNFCELRQSLEARGEVFVTTSDTEVLIRLLRLDGFACLDRCEGMWAFALYNEATGDLYLSRDRFAEKPLYYAHLENAFYFASEIKALEALVGHAFRVNSRQIMRFLVNGYKSLYKQNETFFEEVREVPFASIVHIGQDLIPKTTQYWVPRFTPRDQTLEQSIASFRDALIESVGIRLRADVPIAFCLSGGVDSAAIVSIAAKYFRCDVATFSIIDADERYNERENILATIQDLNCRHTIIETSRDSFFSRLADLVRYHDAPVYTISYYIHSFLSEAIAAQGYRVVCSGTGADEIVTGYYDHFNLYLYVMRTSPHYARYLQEWREGPGRFVRNPHLKNPELYFHQADFRDHIYLDRELFMSVMREPFDEPFREEVYCDDMLRNRMMNELFHEGTRVVLHEDDLNSMRYSIENRSPYLDRRLFEVAYSIPSEHLIQKGLGKYVLREAVAGILNDKVRLDSHKKGFNASIISLVDFDDPATMRHILSDSPIYDLVDREKLKPLMKQRPIPNSLSKFLFNFLSARVFLEQRSS